MGTFSTSPDTPDPPLLSKFESSDRIRSVAGRFRIFSVMTLCFIITSLTATKSAFGATLYSIGIPTAEEQYMLELINRARANPAAEGQRLSQTTDPDIRRAYQYYGVNLILMQASFAALPPAPPLSMSAPVSAAARRHSQDMRDRRFQSHT